MNRPAVLLRTAVWLFALAPILWPAPAAAQHIALHTMTRYRLNHGRLWVDAVSRAGADW